MVDEHPHQKYLDFTYSSFGKPEIGETYIRVPVREFRIKAGFPNHEQGKRITEGILVFEGVVSSSRELSIYSTPEGKEFKEIQEVEDSSFLRVNEPTYLFYIGGFCYDPLGWIEWEIITARVRVEEN